MTELITMHTHSTFCNHAKDPLGDMVQAAVDAGIAHMAATEHYPIPDELDPSKRSTMPAERLEAYIDAVREQQKRDDIDVLLGCELDWLGKDETRALHASDFDRFDVVLGSIHFVDRWLMVSHKNMSRWKSVDLEAFWNRYVELWCEAAKSDMPFTVMAHADVVKKFSPKPEFNLTPLYERMARAAREGGRMVEVNTSGAYAECSEYYPSPSLLQAFRAEGVACTVGNRRALQGAHRARYRTRLRLHACCRLYAARRSYAWPWCAHGRFVMLTSRLSGRLLYSARHVITTC